MTNYGNLHNLIVNLYGEDSLKETRIFEKLRIKLRKRVVDLSFLKRCRDSRVLHDVLGILSRANTAIKRAEIRFTGS